MTPQPLVYIVILNSNHRDDTLACLESLSNSTYRNFKIIVLDNDSADGSVAAVRSKYSDVQIINLTRNLGYAGNNNVGIEEAIRRGAGWVLVLNEDTILDPDCLVELVGVGESNPRIGVVGPLVYHHDEPDVIQSAGGILGKYWQSEHLGKNEVDQGQFQFPQSVEWISGCAIMVRREAMEEAGMLDDDYFIYWEETEWCVRIGRAGWKIIHVPWAKVWHKGVRRNYEPSPSFTYYGTRNHLLTLSKHQAPLTAKVYTWLQLWRTLLSWTIKPKWNDKHENRNAMWMGMVDYLQNNLGQRSSSFFDHTG